MRLSALRIALSFFSQSAVISGTNLQ